MRSARIITILDLHEPVYDCKPFIPRGHKVHNGIRVKNVRGFHYENHK
jgi:hypothetical protein